MSEAHQLVSNFDSCKHRSPDQIGKIIQRCSCQGGNYEVKGFFCNKRNIFKLEPSICQSCEVYESK
jgi:hypothetical protein